MSADAVQTFVVPNDAPEAPKTSRTGAVPNPRQDPMVESAQMRQVAERQQRIREAELDAADTDDSNAHIPDDEPQQDVERLLPDPNDPFELSDGTRVVARHLKLREFLAMIKIVTRGASMAMGQLPTLSVNDPNFQQNMIMLFIFAIPEAPDETADFVRQIIDPAAPDGGWKSVEDEVAASTHLDQLMLNPELEDLVGVIETVIRKEGDNIRRLGKRLADTMSLAQRSAAPKTN